MPLLDASPTRMRLELTSVVVALTLSHALLKAMIIPPLETTTSIVVLPTPSLPLRRPSILPPPPRRPSTPPPSRCPSTLPPSRRPSTFPPPARRPPTPPPLLCRPPTAPLHASWSRRRALGENLSGKRAVDTFAPAATMFSNAATTRSAISTLRASDFYASIVGSLARGAIAGCATLRTTRLV